MKKKNFAALMIALLLLTPACFAGAQNKDTLRVMAYNVLYYGNGCQGPNYRYHEYLRTIVSYTNPDILSLEKMAAVPVSDGDKYATAKAGFADSIITYALDAAFAGRYAYCPFSNKAKGNNMAIVFYDQRKLGFAGVVSSYANITDFNTYKLYYKEPDLQQTHDTTFLYVIANHDRSGDENEEVRNGQITGVMNNLKQHFSHLPNMIDMGDFNSRNSSEPFYQTLTAPADTNFQFFDPPFFPDRRLSYPANWDHDANFSSYFTTSTRESESIPNPCGTGGGAKNWYDHIFLSSWIVNNTNHIKYIPGSYRTVGNDGQRFRVSINNKNTHVNSAAPPDVIEALYQMSNKYPVMASLEVTQNSSGGRINNPEIAGARDLPREEVTIDTKVDNDLILHSPADMAGQAIAVEAVDNEGHSRWKEKSKITGTVTRLKCKLKPGVYTVTIIGHHNLIAEANITKL